GMTGTAKTEEDEFVQIYGLEVVVIPTNKPMQRTDNSDVVYKNVQAKYKAVIEEIVEKHKLGQPVLVGTVSIEKSEQLSNMLKKRGVPHHVLNAKYHAKEAEIIKDAGQKGAVTIATNMAGRGTDIVLGEGVTELGGLHIIGTERHESRRIDNQLRGRSGRQGDPGSSRFYLSLEDDLMRVFGSDNIAGLLDKLGFEEDEPIEHRMITRAIESAQKKVEAKNFSIRKQVLSYDDVMNKQREVIYQQRQMVLKEPRLKTQIIKIMEDVLQRNLDCYLSTDLHQEEWSYAEFIKSLEHLFLPEGRITVEQLEELPRDEIKQLVMEQFVSCYEQKEADFGPEQMAELEKGVMLKVIDSKWIEHLQMMDTLREGIGWRAYAQVDPLVAYKKESFQLFQELMENIQEDLIYYLFRIEIVREMPKVQTRELHYSGEEEQVKQPVHSHKIGRNDPCPCGSGKKYKKCCGA
ncbi:MAG: SEC-C metal-binding domain-containing protein, partial [bacterium]